MTTLTDKERETLTKILAAPDNSLEDKVNDVCFFLEESLSKALEEQREWMDAHANFVYNVLDGMKPGVAYDYLNKSLSDSHN